ncbi:MAG: hypothetical protein ACIARR_04235 [Phycisphaerales bacterium JB059]
MGRNGSRLGMVERTGLYIAATLAVIFSILVVVFAMRGGGTSTATAQDPDREMPPDITDILKSDAGSGMYIELTDKDDPTRLAGVLSAESYDPVSPSERSVVEPRLWYFLKDGRTLHVEASRGRFFMPGGQANSAPESGRLQGDVTIRVFEAIEGGRRPVLGQDEALLTARTDKPLEFDQRNARLFTTGRVHVESGPIEFAGSYMTAVINQVKERLELLEFRGGEFIRYTPEVAAAEPAPVEDRSGGEPRDASGTGKRRAVAGDETPSDQAEVVAPKIDEYQIAFLDGVTISHETMRTHGDKLDLWVRLIDNTIPEGALGGSFEPTPAKAIAEAPTPAGEPGVNPAFIENVDEPGSPEASLASVPETPTVEAGPRPVTLTWTGPLVIKPLGETPAELDGSDASFRLTAERTGLVTLEDPSRGLTGQVVAVEGRATTRDLALSGPGGTIQLAWEGVGSYTGSRAQVNFNAGTVHSRGPSVFDAVLDGASGVDGQAARGRIRCTEQADFQFRVVDGRVTEQLEMATFLGDVEATDGAARLEHAEALTALFIERGDGTTRLAQIEVEGGVASDGQGRRAQGERMTVHFAPGTHGEEIDPVRFSARGDVRVAAEDLALASDELDTLLARDDQGEVIVREVNARGQVDYTGQQESWAKADELHGDRLLEVVTFLGSPAQVGRSGGLISGFEIILDGQKRTAEVYGPGRFEKDESLGEGGRFGGFAWASWSEWMTFDDYRGRIECVGEARAESRSDDRTLDTLSADRVLVELTPLGQVGGASEGGESRELLRVSALGKAGPASTMASAESRVFAADDPERVEQIYYLEGAEIYADASAQTLRVPTTGKMLMLDRRPDESRGHVEGMPLIARGPGQSLFTWSGSMDLDRTSGEATMERKVRVIHQSLSNGGFTELEAERVMAEFRETEAESAPGALRGELLYAHARGAVYFKGGARELIADELEYDAVSGSAFARSAPGNSVTMFDASRPAPVSARTIFWDLVQDRIEVDRPAPVAAPRGG